MISFRHWRAQEPPITLSELVPLASAPESNALQDQLTVLATQLEEHKADLAAVREELAKVTIERDSLKATVVKLRDELKALRAAQTQKPKDEAQK